MKFRFILTLPLILIVLSVKSQNAKVVNTPSGLVISNTGGTDTPQSSSIMEIRSTNKGVLLPSMTTTNRNAIATPQKGLLIFNNVANQFNFFDGTSWQQAFFGNQWSINGTSYYYSGGNVGIGVTTPTQKLQVNGTVESSGGYNVNGVPVANYYYSSPWMTSTSASVDTVIDGTCLRSRRLSIPQLTLDHINTGMVTVYMRVGGIGPYVLPYVSDAGGYTNSVGFFLKKAGEIIVFRHTYKTCRFNSGVAEEYPGQPVLINLPASLEYRVVIINN